MVNCGSGLERSLPTPTFASSIATPTWPIAIVPRMIATPAAMIATLALMIATPAPMIATL